MSKLKPIPMILAIGMMMGIIFACSLGGNTTEKPTMLPESKKTEVSSPTDNPGKIETTNAGPLNTPELKSSFPLPPKAKIVQSSDLMVTATINIPMKDVIAFYRSDAKDKGLTEYELLTSITDNTFNLAFRVPNQDQELVVQGTALGSDSVAFSVRYEEADVK